MRIPYQSPTFAGFVMMPGYILAVLLAIAVSDSGLTWIVVFALTSSLVGGIYLLIVVKRIGLLNRLSQPWLLAGFVGVELAALGATLLKM